MTNQMSFDEARWHFERIHSQFDSEGDLDEITPNVEYSWSKYIGNTTKLGFGILWQKNLLKYKIEKNDIIVIGGNPRYISSILFILKAKFYGAKVVCWSHYRSSTSKKWKMKLTNGIQLKAVENSH